MSEDEIFLSADQLLNFEIPIADRVRRFINRTGEVVQYFFIMACNPGYEQVHTLEVQGYDIAFDIFLKYLQSKRFDSVQVRSHIEVQTFYGSYQSRGIGMCLGIARIEHNFEREQVEKQINRETAVYEANKRKKESNHA